MADVAHQRPADAQTVGPVQSPADGLHLRVPDDPGQHHGELGLRGDPADPGSLPLHHGQGYVDPGGPGCQQLCRQLLRTQNAHGDPGGLGDARVDLQRREAVELPVFQLTAPDGGQMGQHLPAHGVDSRGGQGQPRVHHALDLHAAVRGAAGFGQPLSQGLPSQGPVHGPDRHRPLGLADVAQIVLHRQHGVLPPVDHRVEPDRDQGGLVVFIGFPGPEHQLPVFPFLLPGAEHVGPGLAHIVALGEALSGESVPQVLHIGGADGLAVDGCPVQAGGDGHVFGPLHPALDLYRGHPHGLQLPHPGDQAVVLETQGIFFLEPAVAVGQAAGLGALAPVAGAGAHHRRKIALAGIAHAQGPVDEDLDLDGAVAADIGDVLPAQLPGQHHPADAQGRSLLDALQRVDAHLGGGMDRHLGGHLPQQGHQAQILDDKGVHPGPDRRGNDRADLLQLPVRRQGIQREMDLNPPDMAITHSIRQLVQGKVLGVLPGIEGAGAQINRVGSTLDRRAQGVHGTGGRQQF